MRAQELAQEHKVPVVVEIFLEKITNIAMGTEIDNVDRVQRSRRNAGGRTNGRGTAPTRLEVTRTRRSLAGQGVDGDDFVGSFRTSEVIPSREFIHRLGL